MKWEDYDDLVIKSGGRQWPAQYAWISAAKGQFEWVGALFLNGQWMVKDDRCALHESNGRWFYSCTGDPKMYGIWFTPDQNVNPHQWRVMVQSGQAPASPHPAQPAAPAYPAQPPVTRQRRPAQAPVQAQAWVARGNPAHAYLGNKDLGLLVGSSRVVQPTNGGRLWAVGDVQPDGSIKWVGNFGSVPGAPPPPNAQHPEQFRQPARRPQPTYAPPTYAPPTYAPPQVYAAPEPAYAYAPPTYAPPQVVYAAPEPSPQVVYAQPTYAYDPNAPLAGTPGIPAYDPVTGAPLTPAQAAYQGAAYGAQVAAQSLAAQQQQQDLLSIMMGSGGMSAGCMGGMCGDFDMGMMAMLAGDPALAAALGGGGGYDPTYGGMVSPYY